MVITVDYRFKLMGVFNNKDINRFSQTQIKLAYSLACIIRSILYSEYYKHNKAPNTQHIIAQLNSEIMVTKGISSFCTGWINETLSKTDILLQKILVPPYPDFIRTIEQRVNDLLEDNY